MLNMIDVLYSQPLMFFTHSHFIEGTLLLFYTFTIHMLCITFLLVMLSYLMKPGKFNYEKVEEPLRGNQMVLRINVWSQTVPTAVNGAQMTLVNELILKCNHVTCGPKLKRKGSFQRQLLPHSAPNFTLMRVYKEIKEVSPSDMEHKSS